MKTIVDIRFDQVFVKDHGNVYEPLSEYSGYLYLIDNGGLIKIGSSCRPIIRIKTIIAAGGLINSTAYISNRIKFYKKIEKHIHRGLKDKRIVGEWFNINIDDVLSGFRKIKVDHSKFGINYIETVPALENLTVDMGVSK